VNSRAIALGPITCTFTFVEKMNVFPEQFRHRFVLEYPFHGGVQCPHLTEFQPCTSLPRCTSYQWHLSDWSPCIHANPSDRCGYGYRTRGIAYMYIQISVRLSFRPSAYLSACSSVSSPMHHSICLKHRRKKNVDPTNKNRLKPRFY